MRWSTAAGAPTAASSATGTPAPNRLKDIDCFKLHWSIVPFKDLPEKERDKDRDVIGNMKKILNLGPSTLD